jgi:drug/metabolite transporter (DMT)-like permease
VSAAVGGGLLLGVVSAGAIGGGLALQHAEAAALPRLSLRRPLRSLLALARRPLWCAGLVLGLAGWAAYVAGLRLAPLSLVQTASAGGVVVLAFAGDRPTRREQAGVLAALAGLVLLGLSLTGGSGGGGAASPLALGLWLGASGLAAVAAARPLGRTVLPGAGLGTAAGVLYATADVATKEATSGGSGLVLVPVVLGASVLAFAALQLAFQRGGCLETAGLATVWTNALPIVAGTVVFHEPFPTGAAGIARGTAFCLAVAGGAVLARSGGDPAPAVAALTVSGPEPYPR